MKLCISFGKISSDYCWSCDTQLTMLFEDLARNTSVGKQTDLILLDFSKAFDKVTTQSSSGSSTSMGSEEMHYPGSRPS